MKNRIIGLLLLMVLVVGGCKEEPDDIKIGVINPMTGPFAAYGTPVIEGVKMATEEINDNGGINGKKIKLIIEDDAGVPKNTINAINKLINTDKVSVVIGPLSSATSLAAAPIAEKHKVVQISTLAGTSDLTNAGDYIFRIYPSSKIGATYTAMKAFERISHGNVAILTPLNPLGRTSEEVYTYESEKRNIKIGASESYNDGDKDFKSQLLKIKQSGADILLCSAYWEDGANILKQMKEMNIDIPVFGEDGWHGDLTKLVSYNTITKLYFADLLFGPDVDNQTMRSFIKNYQGKFSKKATTYSATGYDAIYIAKLAIESDGYNSDKIKSYLYSINYQGASGQIRYDKNGDNVGVQFGLYQLDANSNAILVDK